MRARSYVHTISPIPPSPPAPAVTTIGYYPLLPVALLSPRGGRRIDTRVLRTESGASSALSPCPHETPAWHVQESRSLDACCTMKQAGDHQLHQIDRFQSSMFTSVLHVYRRPLATRFGISLQARPQRSSFPMIGRCTWSTHQSWRLCSLIQIVSQTQLQPSGTLLMRRPIHPLCLPSLG